MSRKRVGRMVSRKSRMRKAVSTTQSITKVEVSTIDEEEGQITNFYLTGALKTIHLNDPIMLVFKNKTMEVSFAKDGEHNIKIKFYKKGKQLQSLSLSLSSFEKLFKSVSKKK